LYILIKKGEITLKYYFQSIEDVLKEFKSSYFGLSNLEATNRLNFYGENILKEGKKTTIFQRIISQLLNPMVLVLIVASLISTITAILSNESFADVFIILFVIVINTTLGVVQESKAEKAIDALKKMVAPTAKVLRDGKVKNIDSSKIVVGDIVLLEAGDAIPADGRIIESISLKVEESSLTGESIPIDKIDKPLLNKNSDVPLGDRINMVYMGSVVVYGKGKFVVTTTGMNTEMGKIADALILAKEEQTPLQKNLTKLSKTLTFLVLGISIVMFGVSILRFFLTNSNGSFIENLLDSFILAVSLAVAAIPEGLVAVVTILLSIGVTKMAKRNAIIRKLTAVETLGCTQIICTDKTGTLTKNEMSVLEHVGSDEQLLASIFALCSDAEIGEDGEVIGDPTQVAVVNYAMKIGLPKNELNEKYPRLLEIPFDSERKLMTTFHKNPLGGYLQYTTGAPDVVLFKVKYYYEDGTIHPLNEEKRNFFLNENKRLASKALRVLACSFKTLDNLPNEIAPSLENDLVFVGLVGMMDPIRPEVFKAIEDCKSAGIRPIMITGDHIDTAIAIASSLGILKDKSEALTGAMLDKLSNEEFIRTVENYSVYARVKPEHKTRIVNAWKSRGYITAMTGDGVNDAPSIKSADIGIGMGITGTDVTKSVSDMILADDNFATIVAAVEEGRRIYDNIRKSIQFLLSSNLAEVISIFFATLLGFTILNPAHILFINLITDSLPALALGLEKQEKDIMQRKPRNPKKGIFSDKILFNIFYQGLMVSILTILAYFIGEKIENGVWRIGNSADGMTMAFLTMAMAEIFHAYNMRFQYDSIFRTKTHNHYLFLSMFFSLVLTTMVIYIPFLKEAFGFTKISLIEYLIALSLAILVIPIVEIVKLIQRHNKK